MFNWALDRIYFPAWRIEEQFIGGSNFIHADLEMTHDSLGYICWLYVAVWSALSQSNWAQSTPIQWIEMPICYKPTGILKAKRPTSQNWGNTPLEASKTFWNVSIFCTGSSKFWNQSEIRKHSLLVASYVACFNFSDLSRPTICICVLVGRIRSYASKVMQEKEIWKQ